MGTKDKFDFLSMAIIKEMSSSLGWGRVEKLDGSEDRAQKLKMTLSLVSAVRVSFAPNFVSPI